MLNYLAKPSDFGLYFVGEVVNNGDEEAGSIDIVITLTDEAGNVVGTGSDVVGALSILPPGGKLPFRLYISDPPASWANEKIQVQFDEVTSFDRSYSYTKFETAGVTVTPAQYSGIVVRGQVTNTGSVNAELVQVTFVGRDGSGAVTDVEYSFADLDQIDPGMSSPFEISIFNTDVVPVSYELLVDGHPS